MLPMPQNYAIYPSVVPADVCTTMTIVPKERAFLLREGEEYQLCIISVNDDEPSYYFPSARHELTAIAHNGVLQFSDVFPEEQPHLIILSQGENKLGEWTIYSLKEDLYALRPLKGDLHSHSFRSDGKRDPAALAGHFREQGYEFFALTDHNRYYPGGEIDDAYQGVKMGITRVYGEEVHAPDSVVHIVHVGGKESVAAQYLNHRAEYEAAVAEYLKKVPSHVPEQFRDRYAKAMWVVDRIHQAGGLAIFPHPFWRPGKSRNYNVRSDFARILLESGMFDAYELVGGMGQAGNNQSVALWADLRCEGLNISVVGSSDVHGIEKSASFRNLFTLCFAKENTNDAIVEAVKNGLSVAVEASGEGYERQYRCYGSFRLVSYAQFLLAHYYPQLLRICQGEGVAMRAYAMGEAEKELIELQAKQAANFRRRFLGKEPPVLPSAEILAFEEKWRAVQLAGPKTKGSGVNAPPVTMQI